MAISPLAGQPAPKEMLVDLTRLEREYFERRPDLGDPNQLITAKLTSTAGNRAPVGGLKVVAAHGWFAARPSGTENVYKIYAESFKTEKHLQAIVAEAQRIVSAALVHDS